MISEASTVTYAVCEKFGPDLLGFSYIAFNKDGDAYGKYITKILSFLVYFF